MQISKIRLVEDDPDERIEEEQCAGCAAMIGTI